MIHGAPIADPQAGGVVVEVKGMVDMEVVVESQVVQG